MVIFHSIGSFSSSLLPSLVFPFIASSSISANVPALASEGLMVVLIAFEAVFARRGNSLPKSCCCSWKLVLGNYAKGRRVGWLGAGKGIVCEKRQRGGGGSYFLGRSCSQTWPSSSLGFDLWPDASTWAWSVCLSSSLSTPSSFTIAVCTISTKWESEAHFKQLVILRGNCDIKSLHFRLEHFYSSWEILNKFLLFKMLDSKSI